MNKKYLLINTVVAGVLGIITGKIVGYYKGTYEGMYEGALAKVEELAKEMAEKDKEIVDMREKYAEDMNKVINDLTNKIKEKDEEINTYKTKFSEIARKELEEKAAEERKEKAKEAIKNKKWDEVYKLTERWYNHYPVQMSRSEVFTNLEKDGYITQEERTEAYNYFGSLWNYVGD